MGEPTDKYIAAVNAFLPDNYKRFHSVAATGEGVWITDIEGRRYLDADSGYGAVMGGHIDAYVRDALIRQSGRLEHVGGTIYHDQMLPFLSKITALTGYGKALGMNTGSEGFETAVKMARRWGYRKKHIQEDQAQLLVFEGCFHGRGQAATAAFPDDDTSRVDFGPFLPGIHVLPWNDLGALEEQLANPNTAAVMYEPIQGEAGMREMPGDFMRAMKGLCEEHNVLLIADEVQTFGGKTGAILASHQEGVRPDAVIIAKAISFGYSPVSLVLADSPFIELIGPGEHGSTFGLNPMACAEGSAVCDRIVDLDLPGKARRIGEEVERNIRERDLTAHFTPSGRGAMWGFTPREGVPPAKVLVKLMFESGVKTTYATDAVRFTPPNIAEPEHVDMYFDALQDSVTHS